MSRTAPITRIIGVVNAPLVIVGSIAIWIFWIPIQIEAHLPLAIHQWLDRGDTSAPLVVFIRWPVCLAVFAYLAMMTAAIALRPLLSQSLVVRALRVLPFGGRSGWFQKAPFGMFKDREETVPNHVVDRTREE